jgi:fructose-1,6-bisphosphatase
MAKIGTRLQRFLFETERQIPQATGELSALLSQLEFAGKRISRILSSAGLTDVLGASGAVNVQGEQQQRLDALANEVFLEAFAYGQLVPTVVTEEMDLPAHLPENVASGKYIVFLDPLDGSSNLDVNANVGSIFSVRRLSGRGAITTEADLLSRISLEQVVAGYFLYGPSTTLVYTEGRTVHGFTLDPVIGEFLLSPPRSAFPTTGRTMARTRAPSSTGSVAHACSSSGCARTIPRQGVPTRRATPERSSRTSIASSSKAGSISTRPRERALKARSA